MIKSLSKYVYHLLIGLMLLFLVDFIWKIGFGIPSSYTDLSFHLATAQGFFRANGIVVWDFWESLPLGRPHNYPPLFHLILASILKTGLSPSVSIKLMMELTVVGGLAIYAWGLTKLFNIKVAFWAVIMLFFSSHFIQLSATVMPATIVTFLVPALLHFVINRKWTSYSAILIVMFYLHLFMPYFILFAILIYLIIFRNKLLKPFLIASLISFVVYLPWLIHIILGGWEYIKYLDSNTAPDMWKKYVLINIFVVILTFTGVIILFKKRKKIPDQYYFFLFLSIVVLLPSFIIAGRLIDSHFLVFAVILSTIVISEIWQSKFRTLLVLPFIVYCWFTPILTVGDIDKISFTPSTINYDNILYNRTDYDPAERFFPIIQAINKRAVQGDTITSIMTNMEGYSVDRNYRLSISNVFTPYTNSSTLNLRQPEIYRRPLPDITKSKFLLTSVPINELDSAYLSNLGYSDSAIVSESIKNNFETISYTSSVFDSTLYCLHNKNKTEREQIPPYKFPFYIGNGVLLLLIGVTLYDNRKDRKNI